MALSFLVRKEGEQVLESLLEISHPKKGEHFNKLPFGGAGGGLLCTIFWGKKFYSCVLHFLLIH